MINMNYELIWKFTYNFGYNEAKLKIETLF